MARTKPVAGCWDCHGAAIRWIGSRAQEQANEHAKETGHVIWAGEMDRPDPKPALPPKNKAKKPQPKVEPFNKERLKKKHMCDGKVAHRSAAAAEKALMASGYDREFMNAYQCLYCGKWHLGHIIKPTRKT